MINVNVMALNAASIIAKPVRRNRRNIPTSAIVAAGSIILVIGSILGYDAYSGRLGIIGPQPVLVASGANKIIRVPAGGNVQAAIERAESGDVVELQAGAV